jgi:UDP-GlcNAc:undecaprenyl-phosphate GlcNAc-1-phosphate transferase
VDPEVALLLCASLGLVLAYFATPLAIRVASRLEFYDRPVGYKGHGRPTPYLGGAAVVLAFCVVAGALSTDLSRTLPIAGGALVLWLVGTIDDRRTVSPLLRVAIEATIAAGLWGLDLGWNLGIGAGVDLALTLFWVIAVVNAFNLFDNMDGAASTMACVVAAVLAVLGATRGDIWLAATGAALAGACAGFLPHNLASPSRIFLGDGGSMPVGFIVAALAMVGASDAGAAWQALAMGMLLVGIPALDTCLVMISRARRRIPLLTGGRDHLTHRTRARLRTARAVAVSLGGAQAVLGALAILAINGTTNLLLFAVVVYVVAAGTTIAMLDGRPGAPAAGIAHGTPVERRSGLAALRERATLPSGDGHSRLAWPCAGLGLLVGLSAFANGLYDSNWWVPVGLFALAVLVALALARPVRLSGTAWGALLGTTGIAMWALASTRWAESASQAFADANRLILYAAFLGIVLLSLRDARRAAFALGGVAGGTLIVAGWLELHLLRGEAQEILLGGRLNEPIGYVNAQAAALLIGAFPCLALAERRGHPAVAGLAAGCLTLLGGLAYLAHSRGASLAIIVAAAFVLLVAPGRLRRLAMLSLTLLAIFAASRAAPEATPAGARALLAAAVIAGLAWGALSWAAARLAENAHARASRGARIAVVAVAAAAAIAGVVSAGSIADRVSDQYDAFVNLSVQGSNRSLLSGGGFRYDYWRVAGHEFAGHPFAGVGAGNYDLIYFQRRATTEDVTQPHSLPMQVLAELGVVGALLLLVVLGALAVAVWQRIRLARRSETEALLLVAAGGIAVAWVVQTSVDWLHLLPGVTGAALIAAGVLLRPQATPAPEPAAEPETKRARTWMPPAPVLRWAGAGLLAVVVALGGVSMSRQYLTSRFVDDARTALAEDQPQQALTSADRALRLDADNLEAYYLKAAALARFGDAPRAGQTLKDAAAREPHDFLTYVLIGDLRVRLGDLAGAKRAYAEALRLNPRDPTLQRAAVDPTQSG